MEHLVKPGKILPNIQTYRLDLVGNKTMNKYGCYFNLNWDTG